MHQNIAACLLASQSINQSASQPKQPRRLSYFVKAYTCYIKVVACPRDGGGNSYFFVIRMVRPSIYGSPKKYQEFQVPQKMFEILATPKLSPIMYLDRMKIP